MLTLFSSPAPKIPIQRPPVRVVPVLTHLTALTNRLSLASIIFYGSNGEQRTVLAWECRCEERFVHPASQDYCLACNTLRDDALNATVSEVIAAPDNDVPELIRTIVKVAADQFDL